MQIKLTQKQFEEILDKLKKIVYEYNSRIRGSGVYLKPYHAVYKQNKKYIYIGKYWYRLERIGGRLKWIYLGKTKPIESLPDPPKIPESTIIVENNEVYLVENKLVEELLSYR
ncbi:MAG: hypothetical protein QXV69_02375 [Sulfolobaceae archaeon]